MPIKFFGKSFGITYFCDTMSVKPSTIRLHSDIKKDFDKMSSIKEFGVSKYSTEYVLCYLGNKYYKASKTIENIVFNRTATFSKNATPDLFTEL